jgi:hypothetical protein
MRTENVKPAVATVRSADVLVFVAVKNDFRGHRGSKKTGQAVRAILTVWCVIDYQNPRNVCCGMSEIPVLTLHLTCHLAVNKSANC